MSAYDVVVIGGGVTGTAAALFTARAGLDTLVVDRGPSSLRQCAHLGNYLGFPAGIDIPTFESLMRSQLREAGCETVAERATRVSRADDGFSVETTGETYRTRRVVAATKYTGEYLAPLDDGRMFDSDGDDARFDPAYPDRDGRTPIEGVYAAGPLAGTIDQVQISAGHGARVGHAIIEDERRRRGYWPEIAGEYYDWTTRKATHETGWEANVESWVRGTVPEAERLDPDRVERVVEETVRHERSAAVSEAEIARRTEAGQKAVLERIDDELIREYLAER